MKFERSKAQRPQPKRRLDAETIRVMKALMDREPDGSVADQNRTVSYRKIAKLLGVTPMAVFNRFKKLEREQLARSAQ